MLFARKNPNVEIKAIMFDLDNCLFVESSQLIDLSAIPNNLTPISFNFGSGSYYAINLESIRMIMLALIDKGIRIGFITHGLYPSSVLIPYFEELFLLESGALSGCIYINRDDYVDCGFSKARKLIRRARRDKEFLRQIKAGEILVVDDQQQNIVDLKNHGFRTIQACGFPLPPQFVGIMPVNNNYLQKIVSLCRLQVMLPLLEPIATNIAVMKDSECGESALHPHTLALLTGTKDFIRINRVLGTIRPYELSISELELILQVAVFSEYGNDYERWLETAIVLFKLLSLRPGWKNYRLIINGENLWGKLDPIFFKCAKENTEIPIYELLESWRNANDRKLESRENNIALAIELESYIYTDAISDNYGSSIICLYSESFVWAFIAEYWRFRKHKEHKLFCYSPAKKYTPNKDTTENCTKIIVACLKHSTLKTAAKYMNAELIIQILLCKYHNRVYNNEFAAACSSALQDLVKNQKYAPMVKCEAICLILDYLHTFWVAWDERKLYNDLKKYITAQVSLEPELSRYINMPKYGISDSTKQAQYFDFFADGLFEAEFGLFFLRYRM